MRITLAWQKFTEEPRSRGENREGGECRDRRGGAVCLTRFACQETRYDHLVKRRINVDLHGLKALLPTKPRVRGVSPSDLVRIALLDTLCRSDELAGVRLATSEFMSTPARCPRQAVTAHHPRQGHRPPLLLLAMPDWHWRFRCRPGDRHPVLSCGASRVVYVAALPAPDADLSTLTRNIHHVTFLLRHSAAFSKERHEEIFDAYRRNYAINSWQAHPLRPTRARRRTTPPRNGRVAVCVQESRSRSVADIQALLVCQGSVAQAWMPVLVFACQLS